MNNKGKRVSVHRYTCYSPTAKKLIYMSIYHNERDRHFVVSEITDDVAVRGTTRKFRSEERALKYCNSLGYTEAVEAKVEVLA